MGDLNMRYVAAALLASLGGGEVNAEAIERILSSVGVEADKKQLEIVVKQLAGKSVDELMAAGAGKLASMGGEVVVPPLPALQLVKLLPLLLLRRRRKKSLRRKKMMTWDSVFSTRILSFQPSCLVRSNGWSLYKTPLKIVDFY